MGKVLAGFSTPLGICSITRAELWGVLKGLRLAFSLSPPAISVEMDSKTAFDLITVRCPRGHPCSDLVKDIQYLASQRWAVTFHFIYREGNRCADHLARLGHNSVEEDFNFTNIPRSLFPFIRDDVIGVSFPRFIL
ncbi:uncharacterized protein LOC130722981 [Lotus japonicus]|uniref:uncharacterized protein LOC130722981 n=1 Tax=Lotus japonicus TaxID=34305 RepID=UPI00258DF018|nr:uncharacterized protein LOC130722981 [Lotus japonicus]